MVSVAKFSSPITAWRGFIQYLCTHWYDPIRIKKILIRKCRTREFSATYSWFKEAPFSFFCIAKISIPLAVNELMSCYFA